MVYAQNFYVGSGYLSGSLSGESIGILAASDPEEAHAGLVTCIDYVYAKAYFYNANVELAIWFKPPSEINFSSALLA